MGWPEWSAAIAVRSISAIHEMESAMRRLFILALAVELAAFAPAHAQDSSSVSSASGGSRLPGTAQPGNQTPTDPALSLQGMPCSVSPNATGGVTTSSSCGTDPLSVPTQTLSSTPQAGGGSTSSAPSAGASSSSASSSGGSTTTSNVGGAATTSTASGGGGAPSSSSTVCSSLVPSTSGTVGAGSLTGGSGC